MNLARWNFLKSKTGYQGFFYVMSCVRVWLIITQIREATPIQHTFKILNNVNTKHWSNAVQMGRLQLFLRQSSEAIDTLNPLNLSLLSRWTSINL